MSDAAPTSAPRACYGDMSLIVPITLPGWVRLVRVARLTEVSEPSGQAHAEVAAIHSR